MSRTKPTSPFEDPLQPVAFRVPQKDKAYVENVARSLVGSEGRATLSVGLRVLMRLGAKAYERHGEDLDDLARRLKTTREAVFLQALARGIRAMQRSKEEPSG